MHIATNPLAPGLTGRLSEETERAVRHQRSTGELSALATPDLVAVRRESGFDEGTALRPAFVRDSEKILHMPAYNRLDGKTQVFSFRANTTSPVVACTCSLWRGWLGTSVARSG